jgi:hypothetical protein
VFTTVADPIGSGFVASLAHPSGKNLRSAILAEGQPPAALYSSRLKGLPPGSDLDRAFTITDDHTGTASDQRCTHRRS